MTFVSSLATQGCWNMYDFSQYRAVLKELMRSEESFEDGSKIAYLLQVGKHADSVICKMFRYKRDRDN